MIFQIGDRVTVDVTWSEAYAVPCIITGLDDEGVVAQLEADEPCFDIGKYELNHRGECCTDFLRKL